MRNVVAFVDEFGRRIPFIQGLVTPVIADGGLDQGSHQDIAVFHALFHGPGKLGLFRFTEFGNRRHFTGLHQRFIRLLDRRSQGAKGIGNDGPGFLQGFRLCPGRSFSLETFLGAGVPEFHALRQTFLAKTGYHGQELDATFLRAVPFRGPFLQVAAHLADNDDSLGLRIVFEHVEIRHVIRARVGVPADADGGRHAVGELRANPNDFIRQATGLRDHPEGPRTIEFAGHQVVKRAADYPQPAFSGRQHADG